MPNPFFSKPLSARRICLAIAVAAVADGLQVIATLIAGPLGWAFFVQAVDLVAMVLTSLLIGFHPLLLPTFVVEFVPGVDMLPTWTGCVTAVILLRKRVGVSSAVDQTSGAQSARPTNADSSGPVIDV